MKNIFLILFFLFYYSKLYPNDFEIIPINFNLIGIAEYSNVIISYGNNASYLISLDSGSSWKQMSLNKKGDIISMHIIQNRIYAFNEKGEIFISYDFANSWEEKFDLEDMILAVIEIPDGFFIRGRNYLHKVSKDLISHIKTKLLSEDFDVSLPLKYSLSIASFNDQLIVAVDSSKFIRFDFKLNAIDTLSLNNSGFCSYCPSYYQIASDNYNFYFLYDRTIYFTRDFKKVEKIVDCSNLFFMFKLINNKLYCLDYSPFYYEKGPLEIDVKEYFGNNNWNSVAYLKNNVKTGNILIKDFRILNNSKICISGDYKFLTLNSINDTIINTISDFSDITKYVLPDFIDDSSLIFYNGYSNGEYEPDFYISKNLGVTSNPITLAKAKDKRYDAIFYYKYFEPKTNQLVFWGMNLKSSNLKEQGFFISSDTAKTFTFFPRSDFRFNADIYFNVYNYPYFEVTNDYYVLSSLSKFPNNLYINTKCFFDKKFNLISKQVDSNYIIEFINVIDTNNYLIKCLDIKDTLYKIRTTTNKDSDWHNIKIYEKADSMLFSKEINFGSEKIYSIFYFNRITQCIMLDLLYFEKEKIITLTLNKLRKDNYKSVINNYAIEGYLDTLYVCIQDTLFLASDLYDKQKWNYLIFPDKGSVKWTFKRINDKFYTRYCDSNNKETTFWLLPKSKFHSKPAPVLSVNNIFFDSHDISNNNFQTKQIQIKNLSNETELKIYNISGPTESAFASNFLRPDSNNPIVLKPDSNFKINISFEPKKSGSYLDSITFISNANINIVVSHLVGNATDTIINGLDYKTEIRTYLYSFPPYPNPAFNLVMTDIYWDMKYNIDDADIGIFNYAGMWLSGRNELVIDKTNNYSGKLIWNCSGYDPGVYFIIIRHGDAWRVIPVVVGD